MSETKTQRPKLELPTNIPVHAEIKYLPYNGEGKDYGYGLTYKYTVIHEGVDKTWFVDAQHIYPQVKDFKKGDKIVILKKEEKNAETQKVYSKIEVHPEFFDEKGNLSQAAEPPKPPISSPQGLEAYRTKMKAALAMAYQDIEQVSVELEGFYQDKEYVTAWFTPDVRQKLATTILIDYLKQK